ncbi:YIP1 family protein [Planktotalea sp.]|uniref:YIP1 family protein n=1 Tax=Planktotalea sp. TaxID=2029877 RepID=UPI00329A312A
MLNTFLTLFARTLSEPRTVAAELINMRFERSSLWLALGLAAVLNAIAFQFSQLLTPSEIALPIIFSSPVVFALLIAAGLAMSVYSFTFVGRFFGGTATLEGLMTLLIWLQFMRFTVQVLAMVLVFIVPSLAGLLVLGASIYGMWLLIQFIDVAHAIESTFTSFGILVASGLAIMIGLAILLTLLGVQNMGLTPYV